MAQTKSLSPGTYTATATYTPHTHSVIYTLDGVQSGSTENYTYGSKVTVRSLVTKAGYTVDGWQLDSTKVTATTFQMGDADVTLTAKSTVNQYTVSVKLDGGSPSMTLSGWTQSSGVYTKKQDYGTKATDIVKEFGTVTRTGYTQNSQTKSSDTVSTSGLTITWGWTANSQTVTVDLSGGSISATPSGWTLSSGIYTKAFAYGTTAATVESDFGTPTKAGYGGLQWTATSEVVGTSGMSLTASYLEKNVYAITYTLNGDDLDPVTNASANPSTYTVEDSVTFAAPTRTGQTFSGWSVPSIAKGSTGNVTTTASWTRNTQALTLDYDSAYCTVDTDLDLTKVLYRTKVTLSDGSISLSEQTVGTITLTPVGYGDYQRSIPNGYTVDGKATTEFEVTKAVTVKAAYKYQYRVVINQYPNNRDTACETLTLDWQDQDSFTGTYSASPVWADHKQYGWGSTATQSTEGSTDYAQTHGAQSVYAVWQPLCTSISLSRVVTASLAKDRTVAVALTWSTGGRYPKNTIFDLENATESEMDSSNSTQISVGYANGARTVKVTATDGSGETASIVTQGYQYISDIATTCILEYMVFDEEDVPSPSVKDTDDAKFKGWSVSEQTKYQVAEDCPIGLEDDQVKGPYDVVSPYKGVYSQYAVWQQYQYAIQYGDGSGGSTTGYGVAETSDLAVPAYDGDPQYPGDTKWEAYKFRGWAISDTDIAPISSGYGGYAPAGHKILDSINLSTVVTVGRDSTIDLYPVFLHATEFNAGNTFTITYALSWEGYSLERECSEDIAQSRSRVSTASHQLVNRFDWTQDAGSKAVLTLTSESDLETVGLGMVPTGFEDDGTLVWARIEYLSSVGSFQGQSETAPQDEDTLSNVSPVGSILRNSGRTQQGVWWTKPILDVSIAGRADILELEQPEYMPVGSGCKQSWTITEEWTQGITLPTGKQLAGFVYGGTTYAVGGSIEVEVRSIDAVQITVACTYANHPKVYLDCESGYQGSVSFHSVDISGALGGNIRFSECAIAKQTLTYLMALPEDEIHRWGVTGISVEEEAVSVETTSTGWVLSPSTSGGMLPSVIHVKATLSEATYQIRVGSNTYACTYGGEGIAVPWADLGDGTLPSLIGLAYNAGGVKVQESAGVDEFVKPNGEWLCDGETLTLYPVYGAEGHPDSISLASPEENTVMADTLEFTVTVSAEDIVNTNCRAVLYLGENLVSIGEMDNKVQTRFTLGADVVAGDYTVKALDNPAVTMTVTVGVQEVGFAEDVPNPGYTVPDTSQVQWIQPERGTAVEVSFEDQTAAADTKRVHFDGWRTSADEPIVSAIWTASDDGEVTGKSVLSAGWCFDLVQNIGSATWLEYPDKLTETHTWAYHQMNVPTITGEEKLNNVRQTFSSWLLNGTTPGTYVWGANVVTAVWTERPIDTYLATYAVSQGSLEDAESDTGRSWTTGRSVYLDPSWTKIASAQSDDTGIVSYSGTETVFPLNQLTEHDDASKVSVQFQDKSGTQLGYAQCTEEDDSTQLDEADIPVMYTVNGDVPDVFGGGMAYDLDTQVISYESGVQTIGYAVTDDKGREGALVAGTTVDITLSPPEGAVAVTAFPQFSENVRSSEGWLIVDNSSQALVDMMLGSEPDSFTVYNVKESARGLILNETSTPAIAPAKEKIWRNDDGYPAYDEARQYGAVKISMRASPGRYAVVFYTHSDDSERRQARWMIFIKVVGGVITAPCCTVTKYKLNAVLAEVDAAAVQTYATGADGMLDKASSTLVLSDPSVPNVNITEVSRQFVSQLTTIPILTKSSEYNYCIDLGTKEVWEFTVTRVAPRQEDDTNESDQSKWSNSKWMSQVKDFFDEWQNMNQGASGDERTGGYTVEQTPKTETAFPSINKNVFLSSSLSFKWDRAVVGLTLQFTVATMRPSLGKEVAAHTVEFYTDSGLQTVCLTMTIQGDTFRLPDIPASQTHAQSWAQNTGSDVVVVAPGTEVVQESGSTRRQYCVGGTVTCAVVCTTPGDYTFSISELNRTLGSGSGISTGMIMKAVVVGGGGRGGQSKDTHVASNGSILTTPGAYREISLAGAGAGGGTATKSATVTNSLMNGQFTIRVGRGAEEGRPNTDCANATESYVRFSGANTLFPDCNGEAGGNGKTQAAATGGTKAGEPVYLKSEQLSAWYWGHSDPDDDMSALVRGSSTNKSVGYPAYINTEGDKRVIHMAQSTGGTPDFEVSLSGVAQQTVSTELTDDADYRATEDIKVQLGSCWSPGSRTWVSNLKVYRKVDGIQQTQSKGGFEAVLECNAYAQVYTAQARGTPVEIGEYKVYVELWSHQLLGDKCVGRQEREFTVGTGKIEPVTKTYSKLSSVGGRAPDFQLTKSFGGYPSGICLNNGTLPVQGGGGQACAPVVPGNWTQVKDRTPPKQGQGGRGSDGAVVLLFIDIDKAA